MQMRPCNERAGRTVWAHGPRDRKGRGGAEFFLRLPALATLAILTATFSQPVAHAQEQPKVEETEKGLRLEVPESVSLGVLVDVVSQRLGLNVVYDDALRSQNVNVRAPAPMTEEGLLALLESALRFRGFTLVQGKEDGWIEVVKIEEARARGAPLVLPDEKPAVPSPYRVVTQVVKLEHRIPEQLSQILQTFLSTPQSNLQVVPDQNVVVVSDRLANVQEIERIVHLLDKGPTEVVLKEIKLQNRSATQVSGQLTQLLQQKARLEGGPGGEAQIPVHLLPQDETGKILVLAAPDRFAEVEELASALDTPGEALTMRPYAPKHVPADLLRQQIQQLISAQPADTRPAAQLRMVVPQGQASLIAVGPPSALEAFDKFTELLDQPSARAAMAAQRGNLRVYRLKNTSAAEIATTLGELLGQRVRVPATEHPGRYEPARGLRVVPGGLPSEQVPAGPGGGIPPRPQPPAQTIQPISFQQEQENQAAPPEPLAPEGAAPAPTGERLPGRITVVPNINGLAVSAGPELHAEIERLIGLLDVRPPQVMLEAIVVEVTCTNDFRLGVELESVEKFTGSGVGSLIFTSFGLSMIDPVTGAKVLNPATGFNSALIRPDEIPLIVQALESETQARIVSSPRILVNDNQPALLSRVDEEPFTSTNFRDAVTTTSFSGFAQAGTTLSVTPHIGENEHLLLQYEVQVNSFRGSASQAGVPPARTTNVAQSSVTIPDGWAIVVGGLVDERDDFTEDRVPVLGRLPGVGVAFRNTVKMRLRKTLYVFLRARILKQEQFADLKYVSSLDEQAACLPPSLPPKHPPRMHPVGDASWQPHSIEHQGHHHHH